MKIYFTFFLYFFSTLLCTQEKSISNNTIRGQILNQKTLEPIPYAHIVFSNTGVGTVTNEIGTFRLVVPNKYADTY